MSCSRTPNVISVVALTDGLLPCDKQAGLTKEKFGRRQSHVKDCPSRASVLPNSTPATSGQTSTVSSPPATLQSCLGSRLQARMDLDGSPEFTLTWKTQVISSRLQICALLGRAHPISDSVTTSWPTPSARDHFPPHTPEYIQEKKDLGHGMSNLNDRVGLLIGWPTPNVPNGGRKPKGGMSLTGRTPDGKKRQVDILHVVRTLTLGWPSPTAVTDSGGAALCKWGGTRSRERLREAVGNTTLNGALNPDFPLWLMGFPTEWINYAPSAMQWSSR